jgi:hypothetical protein
MSDAEFFAALDAGYVPSALAAQLAKNKPANENGFDFSNASIPALPNDICPLQRPAEHPKAA